MSSSAYRPVAAILISVHCVDVFRPSQHFSVISGARIRTLSCLPGLIGFSQYEAEDKMFCSRTRHSTSCVSRTSNPYEKQDYVALTCRKIRHSNLHYLPRTTLRENSLATSYNGVSHRRSFKHYILFMNRYAGKSVVGNDQMTTCRRSKETNSDFIASI